MADGTYSVYCHTTPSGKRYIGITERPVEDRWAGGSGYRRQVFYHAIQKYGWDNIRHEVLFAGLSRNEAIERERELVEKYKANERDYGYNQTTGGDLCKFNEETCERIRNSLTGRTLSEIHKAHIAECRTGWTLSEETKRKIGEKHRNKVVTPETCEKLKEAHQWQARAVRQLSMGGDLIKTYPSVGQAAEEVGCSKLLIRRVCQGKRKSTNGFRWEFV